MRTPPDDGRFLYHLVHSLTDRQLFFGFWAFIACAFAGLIYAGFKKSQRRNFRQDGPGVVPRVDSRQLKGGSNLPKKS